MGKKSKGEQDRAAGNKKKKKRWWNKTDQQRGIRIERRIKRNKRAEQLQGIRRERRVKGNKTEQHNRKRKKNIGEQEVRAAAGDKNQMNSKG